jgi:hypothetical protein
MHMCSALGIELSMSMEISERSKQLGQIDFAGIKFIGSTLIDHSGLPKHL